MSSMVHVTWVESGETRQQNSAVLPWVTTTLLGNGTEKRDFGVSEGNNSEKPVLIKKGKVARNRKHALNLWEALTGFYTC